MRVIYHRRVGKYWLTVHRLETYPALGWYGVMTIYRGVYGKQRKGLIVSGDTMRKRDRNAIALFKERMLET